MTPSTHKPSSSFTFTSLSVLFWALVLGFAFGGGAYMLSILSQNMEEEKQAEARQSMKSTRAFALVGLKHIHAPIISSSARPATPFFFFFFLFFSFLGFSETPLDEIYRRCGEIETSCSDIITVTSAAIRRIDNGTFTYNAYSNGFPVTTTVKISELGGMGIAKEELQRCYQNAVEISNRSGIIRQLATQLSSGGGGSYDDTDLLAELEEIEKYVHDLQYDFVAYFNMWVDFYDWFDVNKSNVTDYFENSSSFYGFMTNSISRTLIPLVYGSSVPAFPYNYSTSTWVDMPSFVLTRFNPYYDSSRNTFDKTRFKSISDYLISIMQNQIAFDGGILTTLYTNTVDTINYNKRSLQLLEAGFSAVSNSTIRPYIDELYKSPLDEVTSDFYAHLTNSYLSAYSGTNPNTNWFRRVETLLAALVFQGSGHEEDIEEVGEAADKAESDRTTLEGTFDAENVLSFDLGQQVLDTNFHLPSIGSQFPQSLSFTVPNYGGSGSASEDYTITIDTTKIRPLCELIRACFRMLYLLFLIFILWAVYKLFIKYLRFIFNLFSGLNP